MKKLVTEILQITLAIGLLIGISFACKKNRFKKEVFLDELYQYKTSPEINKAIELTTDFQNQWDLYSTDKTTSNYEAVKTQFHLVSDQMEAINFYNLGDVGAIYIFSRFYKTTVDTTGVMEAYNSQESFNSIDIANYTNTKKGLFTLEYLLFSNSFQDSLTDSKFISFVTSQISDFKSSLIEFQNSWNIYQDNFIKSNGTGVSDSYNIVINKMIHVLEDLINKRIALPMQSNDPSIGVGYYSDRTFKNIKKQVEQLNAVYIGIGTNAFNSVYNNVRKKNKKLADKVSTKFEEIIDLNSVMTKEMAYYISEDPVALNTYNDKLIELLGLFKVDIQEELDIIITFGDTDGD